MSALRWLKALGASVILRGEGKIEVGSLDTMTHSDAERVICVARQNQPAIMAELKGDDEPSLQAGWVQ